MVVVKGSWSRLIIIDLLASHLPITTLHTRSSYYDHLILKEGNGLISMLVAIIIIQGVIDIKIRLNEVCIYLIQESVFMQKSHKITAWENQSIGRII